MGRDLNEKTLAADNGH